ncbi:DUF3630 family protein [Psychrosphaera aestuarii]|uniref:DUF3630 family protein n=1 Tax=Psychrosphaera aestuarii TaxID=1266052 RepID=UPI001B31F1DE|nr:DUF3630 family protein [Psychrosphaera aestuarii]
MTKFTYSLTTNDETNITQLSISPEPDWDDFKEFAAQFVADVGADVRAEDYGMDRHQVDYELNGERFLLHYEHYSQSVWIERQ